MNAETFNRCFMKFQDRAERITAKQVAETFVAVGPLLDLLQSSNNQIMYGRRGTGKTHALRYFQTLRNAAGDVALYIDATNIGSNGSIYNDASLPLSERAVRLLVDICSSIHHGLLEIFAEAQQGWNLADAAEVLDGFVGAFTETRVDGDVDKELSLKHDRSKKSTASATLNVASSISGALGLGSEKASNAEDTMSKKQSGHETSWIDFAYFSRTIRKLAKYVGAQKRVWLLIDEWTTIPPELQPYLADLLRRSMFSIPNMTVKIAAIEHRATFKIDLDNESYIGFEVGADISAAINLDDYLVIDNDEGRSKSFFKNFIANHAQSVALELGVEVGPTSSIVANAFTQSNVFTEFVRATEGVPRDAMHILAIAAQRAGNTLISMPVVRTAAYNFFQSEKYNTIQANPENRSMLEFIRDQVIGGRRTKAFLLPVGTEDLIIDRLFDRRALHILNRNRSAAHRPGERFIVYKLDYGLYVDLINTDKFPTGLLLEGSGEDIDFEVPAEDARSYRRAILDLNDFYSKHPEVIRRRSKRK